MLPILILSSSSVHVTYPQGLTRSLDRCLVASAELMRAVEREAAELALLAGVERAGPHALRGRDAPIEVWAA